jgi:hypothetical protein
MIKSDTMQGFWGISVPSVLLETANTLHERERWTERGRVSYRGVPLVYYEFIFI